LHLVFVGSRTDVAGQTGGNLRHRLLGRRSDGVRCGANAFAEKTAVGISLPEVVRQTARFWLAINEPPPMVRGAKAPTG
jgi:hypothetical protein